MTVTGKSPAHARPNSRSSALRTRRQRNADAGTLHPGRTLATQLRERGLNPHALALRLRVPSTRLADIVNGKRGITAETALRLGRYFGNGAAFWISLQTAYDLAVAERKHGDRVAVEVEIASDGKGA